MNFIICGFAGAGKSTLLSIIAGKNTHYLPIDLDIYILAHNPSFKNIKEIFDVHGENHFRALELKALGELLMGRNQVIAVGGGTLNARTLGLLEADTGVRVLWLNTPIEICYERIARDESRPVTFGKSLEEVTEIYELRKKFYSRFKAMSFEDILGLFPQTH